MHKMTLLLVLLAACSPLEAPPMAGICVDRVAPNLFDATAADVPFKQCEWRGRSWLCRLEDGEAVWRCAPFTRTVPATPAAPAPADPSE